jgi:hypothetical protein
MAGEVGRKGKPVSGPSAFRDQPWHGTTSSRAFELPFRIPPWREFPHGQRMTNGIGARAQEKLP